MRKVLFSCVGTSDPVRGQKDGPILHILRKYRPDTVVLFFTTEIQALAQKDDRYGKIREHMKQAWGYEPQWQEESLDLKKAHDLDVVYTVMKPALKKYLNQYAKDEILVNLSSGTPQMKYFMIDLAKDLRYRCLGIQVSNPDDASGQDGRSNSEGYVIEEEIKGNLDEDPNYTDRCVLAQMVAVERNHQWEQLRGVLDLYDFEAAAKMNMLPDTMRPVLEHLLQRSRLVDTRPQDIEDPALAQQLFPICFGPEDRQAKSLCEYYLILRNMQKSRRITEFILRLNPFIVSLQEELIQRLLQEQYHFSLWELIQTNPYNNKQVFMVEWLQEKSPKLLEEVNRNFGTEIKSTTMSIRLGNALLRSLGAPKHICRFFGECERLNMILRNSAAHDLTHFTEKNIARCLQYDSAELIHRIEDLIPDVFPQYSRAAFEKYYRVYDLGIQYILDHK